MTTFYSVSITQGFPRNSAVRPESFRLPLTEVFNLAHCPQGHVLQTGLPFLYSLLELKVACNVFPTIILGP